MKNAAQLETGMEADAKSVSPSTDRTLAILEALSEKAGGLTVAELTRVLEVPQNSVFRITATLHERGYLHRRESDRRFVLSNRLFDLARPKVNEKSLVVCAYEAMKALRDRCGETVQLLVFSEAKAVVLEQVTGRHAVKVMGEVGLRVPLYSCAPGKAILSRLPEEEFESWMAGRRLKKFTATTLATRKALEADLAMARRRGYAADVAEGIEGIHCVAAPILNDYEYPVAAVTLMAPVFRLAEDAFEERGNWCIETAAEIRDRLLT
jgi:DNA-binding IclR family transcriptional regulator